MLKRKREIGPMCFSEEDTLNTPTYVGVFTVRVLYRSSRSFLTTDWLHLRYIHYVT